MSMRVSGRARRDRVPFQATEGDGMSEETMVALVQQALEHEGITDEVVTHPKDVIAALVH